MEVFGVITLDYSTFKHLKFYGKSKTIDIMLICRSPLKTDRLFKLKRHPSRGAQKDFFSRIFMKKSVSDYRTEYVALLDEEGNRATS